MKRALIHHSLAKRSPGERAFDRCFYPFGVVLLLPVITMAIHLVVRPSTPHRQRSEAELAAAMPDPAWLSWIPFTLGVLLCAYWVWALWSVLRAWHDPAARILRVSSILLLLFDAGIILALISEPFQVLD